MASMLHLFSLNNVTEKLNYFSGVHMQVGLGEGSVWKNIERKKQFVNKRLTSKKAAITKKLKWGNVFIFVVL